MISRTRAGVKLQQLAMENVWKISKCTLERTISLLHGKTNRLHVLMIATQRGGVFISEASGRIGVWCINCLEATDG